MRSITLSGSSVASIWKVIRSAPALAKGSTNYSGSTTIIWTSKNLFVFGLNDLTTGGPIVRLGTNWLSITSMWIQCAPPSSHWDNANFKSEKSADKIDGASLNSEVICDE